MKVRTKYLIIGAVLIAIIGSVFFWSESREDYNPAVDPTNFVSNVNNKYFTLMPGKKFIYEKRNDEGLERIEIVIRSETKKVMGIATTVVWDKVFLNNELVEDTRDWYAQDKEGNVWYFGEVVDNYENGKLKDHKGSWEAGVDGAKPGIIMLTNPQVGRSYRQEYYKGEAEDMADILAFGKKVAVPYKTFENCLQTRDWSMIDQSANEYKYYCPSVGFVVLEESVKRGQGKVELVNVSTP